MDRTRGVLVIALAFNEEASIGTLVSELRAKLPEATVLVVDDGSHDATSERATQAGALVIRHPFNLGVAAGETTGLIYAARNGFRAAVRLDGDGQHDPSFVPRLVEALGEADLAVGVRSPKEAGYQAKGLRKLGGQYLAWLVSKLSGVRVTDVTSGFRAFGPRAIDFFSEHFPNDYPEPESIVMAARARLTVKEVTVTMRPRQGGRSSFTLARAIFFMLKVTFALTLETLRPSYGR